MGIKQSGRQMANATDGGNTFTFDATGTKYTEWYDVSMLDELITFVEATWTSKSGATLDVSLEIKNPFTGTAFDPSSAHTQLTNTGSNFKQHSSFGTVIRLKLVAGGAFGAGEEIAVSVYYVGKSP